MRSGLRLRRSSPALSMNSRQYPVTRDAAIVCGARCAGRSPSNGYRLDDGAKALAVGRSAARRLRSFRQILVGFEEEDGERRGGVDRETSVTRLEALRLPIASVSGAIEAP